MLPAWRDLRAPFDQGKFVGVMILNAVPRGRAVKSANKESRLVAARPAVFSAKDN
jgi:hypothetical protein